MIEIFGSRELVFEDGTFLPAASGIVKQLELLVVSDERPLLGRFPLVTGEAWEPAQVQLLGGLRRAEPIVLSDMALPEDPVDRKAVKPDLEAVAILPGGHVVVLGSGSTPRRERGWIVRNTLADRPPVEISLSKLYAELRRELFDLNIEGAAVDRHRSMWLAQRGNGAQGRNALVELALPEAGTFSLRSIKPVELPGIDGVPLTLTDLEPREDSLLYFTAVAEDVASTYHDGPCVGSAVGVVDPRSGEVVELDVLEKPWKTEGVALIADVHDRRWLCLVVDPDDPAKPGLLLHAWATGGRP